MGRVGTCGYSYYDPPEGWKDEYESKLQAFADEFDLVEINSTFYDLPQVSTAERWRREADGVNEDFEFTLKAWQALTHPWQSPTWRRADDLTEEQQEAVGYLTPEEPVFEAWRDTRDVAEALGADTVVVQMPPSFEPTDEYVENAREFFGEIDRGGLTIAWEPRDGWKQQRDLVAELCDDLDLVHVVDPLRRDPVGVNDWAYLRCHGLNEDPYDYDYDYDEDELADLAEKLDGLEAEHDRVYCLFNNHAMFEDAKQLQSVRE